MDQPEASRNIKDNVFNGMESVLAVVVFIAVYRLLNLEFAIGAITITSLWFAYSRYRRKTAIGKFLPILVLTIVTRGVVGIIFGADVYFKSGIAIGALIGLTLIISVFISRNLLILAVPYIFDFPETVQKHPFYLKTINIIAVSIGIYYILKAGFDLWLLNRTSIEGFVIGRSLLSWAFGLIIFWGCVIYAANRFKKIPEFEGFGTMLQRQNLIYREAFEDRFKRKPKS